MTMTSTPPASAPQPADPGPPEPTWTMGQAAAYLNGGGVDFGIDARAVRRMADDPRNQIRAGERGDGEATWRRALASTVRAERARRLRAIGRDDPEWPTSGAPGAPMWPERADS